MALVVEGLGRVESPEARLRRLKSISEVTERCRRSRGQAMPLRTLHHGLPGLRKEVIAFIFGVELRVVATANVVKKFCGAKDINRGEGERDRGG